MTTFEGHECKDLSQPQWPGKPRSLAGGAHGFSEALLYLLLELSMQNSGGSTFGQQNCAQQNQKKKKKIMHIDD